MSFAIGIGILIVLIFMLSGSSSQTTGQPVLAISAQEASNDRYNAQSPGPARGASNGSHNADSLEIGKYSRMVPTEVEVIISADKVFEVAYWNGSAETITHILMKSAPPSILTFNGTTSFTMSGIGDLDGTYELVQ